MDRPAQSRSLAGPIVMILGGAATVVGSLLSWASVSVSSPLLGGLSQTVSGTSSSDGKVTLVCGIGMVIAGLIIWLRSTRGLRLGLAIVAIVAGLVVAGIAVYDISTKDRQANRAFRAGVRSVPAARGLSDAQIDALRRQFGVKFSLEAGIIITLVGGAIGVVGGIVTALAGEPEVAPSAGLAGSPPVPSIPAPPTPAPRSPSPAGAAPPPPAPPPSEPDS